MALATKVYENAAKERQDSQDDEDEDDNKSKKNKKNDDDVQEADIEEE